MSGPSKKPESNRKKSVDTTASKLPSTFKEAGSAVDNYIEGLVKDMKEGKNGASILQTIATFIHDKLIAKDEPDIPTVECAHGDKECTKKNDSIKKAFEAKRNKNILYYYTSLIRYNLSRLFEEKQKLAQLNSRLENLQKKEELRDAEKDAKSKEYVSDRIKMDRVEKAISKLKSQRSSFPSTSPAYKYLSKKIRFKLLERAKIQRRMAGIRAARENTEIEDKRNREMKLIKSEISRVEDKIEYYQDQILSAKYWLAKSLEAKVKGLLAAKK